MDERTARTIGQLKDWSEIARLEKNAKSSDRWTAEIENALANRARELARAEIASATNITLDSLTPVEERVVQAVTEYVALKRRAGSHAQYTLKQIRLRGLRGAVEASVSKPKPSDGFEQLVQADLAQLSYERIVLDHPKEFSAKALKYARRTLGIDAQPESHKPVKLIATQGWTEGLVGWLKGLAVLNDGALPLFTNAQAAAQIGIEDLTKYGRAYGNLQSRIDYACFRLGLPALGLAGEAPFAKAWDTQGRSWKFPVATMQEAARAHAWKSDEFDRIVSFTRALPGQAHPLWKEAITVEEAAVRQWATGEPGGDDDPSIAVGSTSSRPPRWSRDELILALDLYLRNRAAPPAKSSDEVGELSELLGQLGRLLGTATLDVFRNRNGVYMKMMNFRRFDPEFTTEGKVGLTRGNKDEETVWNEFSGDPDRLKEVVAAIRRAVVEGDLVFYTDDDDDPGMVEAKEGRLLTRVHRSRERNRKIVEQKKNSHLSLHGRLFCEACGFEFGSVYGPGAHHIVDCHHTKPVHTMVEGDTTRLDDLVLLCPNCHRVIHAHTPWLTVERLRELLGTKWMTAEEV